MDTDLTQHIRVRSLGKQPYIPIWKAMKAFTETRSKYTADEIWMLEHTPVFTQGQAGKAEHLLATDNIPVVQVDRGGQVTYHGPGQLVAYLLIDLKRKNLGVRQLVTRIEGSIVSTLQTFTINSAPRTDAPGVYTENSKIASLGLRIRKGCSFHGLALNINMNLEPFQRINPCGYQGLPVSQVADFIDTPDSQAISDVLINQLKANLGYTTHELTTNTWTAE